MESNPVVGVRAPKAPRSLPKALSVEQAQVLLDRPGLPKPNTPIECRDQAMFEVLYSSGLRLAELVSLDWRYTRQGRSEEHTSELQSLMRISSAVFCLKKNNQQYIHEYHKHH